MQFLLNKTKGKWKIRSPKNYGESSNKCQSSLEVETIVNASYIIKECKINLKQFPK